MSSSQPVVYSKFDDIAAKKIGFYVYALQDPTNGTIFYVGKGVKNRWFSHIMAAQKSDRGDPSEKLEMIRAIEGRGEAVKVWIVRHGIHDEKTAYEVESAVAHTLKIVGSTVQSAGIVDLKNLVVINKRKNNIINNNEIF